MRKRQANFTGTVLVHMLHMVLAAIATAPVHAFEARDGEQLISLLRELAPEDLPRPLGSPAQKETIARIRAKLEDLKLETAHRIDFARGPNGNSARVENLVARVRGTASGGEALLFCAHHDTVGASPGASDLVAIVALLDLARAAQEQPPARDWIFLFSDGVEVGLQGSTAFFEHHPFAESVVCTLVLEPCGPRGPPVLYEATAPGRWLANAAAAAQDVLVTSAWEELHKGVPKETDLLPARLHGRSGAVLGPLGGRELHHTGRDRTEHITPEHIQRFARSTHELARALDAHDSGEESAWDEPERFVFARLEPLPFFAVPLAPARLIGALFALILALTLWRTRTHTRERTLTSSSQRIVASLRHALAPALSIGSAGLGAACFALISSRLTSGVPHRVAPHAELTAALASAFFAVALVRSALLLKRRSASSGLPFTPSSFHYMALAASLGLALAPSPLVSLAGVLLLLPLGLASLPGLPGPIRGALAATGCLALALALESGLGARLVAPSPMIRALGPAMFGLGIGALLSTCGPRPVAALGAAALLAAVIAGGIIARAPVDAGWSNLRYIGTYPDSDSSEPHARYEHSTYGQTLDLSRPGVSFSPSDSPPFPWLSLDRSMQTAPAAVWDVQPPRFEALEQTEFGQLGRLVSVRGADRLHLHLEQPQRLLWAEAEGRRIEDFAPAPSYLFYGLQEVRVLLQLGPQAGTPAPWLLDLDWNLPPTLSELRDARPRAFAPVGDGDVSILGAELLVR